MDARQPVAWKRALTAMWKILLFVVIWGALLAPAPFLMRLDPADGPLDALTRLGLEALGLAAILAASLMTVRYVDKRSFTSLGFERGAAPRDALVGLGVGSAMILLALGCAALPGWVEILPAPTFSWSFLGLLAAWMLVNSATQEILFRGYPLQTVESGFGTPAALVVSSLIFTGAHAGAIVEGGVLPAINLFTAGMLLGLAYTTTRSLWLPIALHFSWNFLQGPVLGIAVSGQALGGDWTLLELTGPTLLTGGEFGLEGGLFGTLATLFGIGVLVVLGRRRPQGPAPDRR